MKTTNSNKKGYNMYNIFLEIKENGKIKHGFFNGCSAIIGSPAQNFTSKFLADSTKDLLEKDIHPSLKIKAWVINVNLNK